MKRVYESPKLVNHGTVREITAFSFDSAKKDTYFGPPLGTTPIAEGTGSYDGCVQKDGVCR